MGWENIPTQRHFGNLSLWLTLCVSQDILVTPSTEKSNGGRLNLDKSTKICNISIPIIWYKIRICEMKAQFLIKYGGGGRGRGREGQLSWNGIQSRGSSHIFRSFIFMEGRISSVRMTLLACGYFYLLSFYPNESTKRPLGIVLWKRHTLLFSWMVSENHQGRHLHDNQDYTFWQVWLFLQLDP